MDYRILRPARRFLRCALTSLVCLLSGISVSAQSVGTGSISGRVYNPSTKKFVRDAEIRVDGTTIMTASESGGHYSLGQVPAGQVSITVSPSPTPAIPRLRRRFPW